MNEQSIAFVKAAGHGILLTAILAGCSTAPEAAPRWWKGNTHTHTLWSDGNGAPELVADWYRSHGYHFLVLSDHNILSEGEHWFPITPDGRLTAERVSALRSRFGPDWVAERTRDDAHDMRLKTLDELRARFESPGRFLFIQGEEITDAFESHPVHVNGLHLAEMIEPQGGTSVRDTMQRNVDAVIEQGRRLGRSTLAHINHPNYGWAITPAEIATLRGERFFEVYNGHPAVRNHGDADHPSTEMMWDIALTTRLDGPAHLGVLYGLATDDAHAYHGRDAGASNPGRGWLMVRAPRLEPEAIIEALRHGAFYASTGVTLESFGHEGARYDVRIAPEAGVEYRTQFIGTRRTTHGLGPVGEVLAEVEGPRATYRLGGDELYVRAKVISSRPHPNPHAAGDVECAWLQPVTP